MKQKETLNQTPEANQKTDANPIGESNQKTDANPTEDANQMEPIEKADKLNQIEIEVFKTGNYGEKGTYSESDLEQIAADYNPQIHEAPITLDHAQQGPALGWVQSLKRTGSKLIATLKEISPELTALIKTGAYKKRSIELYKKFKETGKPYLRALTFLGAQTPEVKSLADPLFSDNIQSSEKLDIIHEEENDLAPSDKSDKSDKSDQSDQSDPSDPSSPPGLAQMAEISRLQKLLRRNELATSLEKLKSQGRILPAHEEMGIIDFMMAIDGLQQILFGETAEKIYSPEKPHSRQNANSEETEFSSGKITPLEWFLNFIAAMPNLVHFSETAPQGKPEKPYINFNSENSAHINFKPGSIDLHNRAVVIMENNPRISYAEAILNAAKM